jgi:menaquinol-cytochrome c reductase iron-sulfur subunit
MAETDRRGFLKALTVGLGAVIGVIAAVPLVRAFLHPMGRRTVTTPDRPLGPAQPIDVGDLPEDGTPVKVELVADGARDAWGRADQVRVGAAWVRRDRGQVVALSAVCPHLGCAVNYDASARHFACPCHKSAFALDGAREDGSPAKRDMDRLEVSQKGPVTVVWKRFRTDIAEKEEI